MKQIYILTTLLLLSSIEFTAQVTDLITGLDQIGGIAFNGNDLYFTQKDKISKIDVTSNSPTATPVITGLNNVYTLAIKENVLYFAHNDGKHKISKIDINITAPLVEDVLELTNTDKTPTMMQIQGNELFFQYWDGGNSLIVKIDTSSASPSIINVVDPVTVFSCFEVHENELFFTQNYNYIYKIDLSLPSSTAVELTDEVSGPNGMFSQGNILYFTEHGGKISKLDVNQPKTSYTEIASRLYTPMDLYLKENVLYVSEIELGKIYKIDLGTLSAPKHEKAIDLKLFPSPASNFIQISNLNKKKNYTIYNSLGTKVKSGPTTTKQKISIGNLSKGFYILQLENDSVFKFIKE